MKKVFQKFLGNKPYYAFVAVCIVTVGAVVTMVMKNHVDESMQRQLALSDGTEIPELSVPVVPARETQTAPAAAAERKGNTVNEEPEKEEIASQETFGQKFVIEPPVAGQVLNGFSGEELIYDKTFEDWRVHSGIDIAAEKSAPVKACAAGVVEDVFLDAMDGFTIVINHGNQYQSVYKNLSGDKMIKKGESVEKGQTISGVGETGVSEAGLPNHLHFELKKKEEYIDPILYYEE